MFQEKIYCPIEKLLKENPPVCITFFIQKYRPRIHFLPRNIFYSILRHVKYDQSIPNDTTTVIIPTDWHNMLYLTQMPLIFTQAFKWYRKNNLREKLILYQQVTET